MRIWKIVLLTALGIIVVVVGLFIYASCDTYYDRDLAAKGDLQSLRTQLDLYKSLGGSYPTTEQGLDALVTRPQSSPVPERWYQLFRESPKDPWSRPYEYRLLGSDDPRGYDLFSLGSDGVESGDDIHWTDAMFKPPPPEQIAGLLEFSGPVSLRRQIASAEELARAAREYGRCLASFSYADPAHTSERITITVFVKGAFLGEKRSEFMDRLSKLPPKSSVDGTTFGVFQAADGRSIVQFPFGFGPGGAAIGALIPCHNVRYELVVLQHTDFHDDEDPKQYSHHASPRKELRAVIESIESLVFQ